MKISIELFKQWQALQLNPDTTHGDLVSHVETLNKTLHRLEVALLVQNARVAGLEDALSQCLSGQYTENFKISELLNALPTVTPELAPIDALAPHTVAEQLRQLLISSRNSLDHHLLTNRSARRDCDYDLIAQIDAALKGTK